MEALFAPLWKSIWVKGKNIKCQVLGFQWDKNREKRYVYTYYENFNFIIFQQTLKIFQENSLFPEPTYKDSTLKNRFFIDWHSSSKLCFEWKDQKYIFTLFTTYLIAHDHIISIRSKFIKWVNAKPGSFVSRCI